jgi:hypothetical protein
MYSFKRRNKCTPSRNYFITVPTATNFISRKIHKQQYYTHQSTFEQQISDIFMQLQLFPFLHKEKIHKIFSEHLAAWK